jgi:hypothetical protein
MADNPPAPWVREVYLNKLRDDLNSWEYFGDHRGHEFQRMAQALHRLPEGPAFIDELAQKSDASEAKKLVEYYRAADAPTSSNAP